VGCIVLIDSTHKRWCYVTVLISALAVGVYAGLSKGVPGGLTGGSTAGLWYGTIGAGLMVYAGLLSAVRHVPRWRWVGSRKTWLKGHIWLGLLSSVFLLCHSGFRWGGTVEILLWLAVIGTLATGVFGLLLQQLLPRLLTTRVPCEAPYEQIPHLCLVMRRKADALVDAVSGPFGTPGPNIDNTVAAVRFVEDSKAQLRTFYEKEVRPFLSTAAARSPLANQLQAEARFAKLRSLAGMAEVRTQLDELAGLCEERRLLADQERIHFWLHSWLYLHIPLSAAVLVLGIAHVVTALYY
jgi:hypothetical protein